MWCKRWFVAAALATGLSVPTVGCEVAEDDVVGDAGHGGDDSPDGGKPGVDASVVGRDASIVGRDASVDSAPGDGGHQPVTDAGDAAPHDDDAGAETGEDAGNDDDDDGGGGEEIEIAGTWQSNFGGTEMIDSNGHTAWGSTSAIVEYDNDANYFISQNPSDDAFSPNKFNKVLWTEISGGAFYYCFVDFGLDTAADARNTTNTADDSDPDNGGCGGFAWTKLSE